MIGPGTLLISYAALLVSAVLLPPTNVTISSRNFQHILTWDDPNNEPNIYYSVDYRKEWGLVKKSRNCSNITSRQCDLTKDFTEIMYPYRAMVTSFTHHEKSAPAFSRSFVPIENTVIGPAEVKVVGSNHCITVILQPPVSHLWSEEEQCNVTMLHDDVYPLLSYNIHMLNAPEVQPVLLQEFSTKNSTTFSNLPPNTNFCVSVNLSVALNLEASIRSEPKCAITEPRLQNDSKVTLIIVVVVCGFVLLLGIVLVLFGLDRAGFICRSKKFFPKVLKSFPHSSSGLSGMNDYALPTHSDSVKITEYKVEVEEKQENKDHYHEGGYANRKRLVESGTSTEGSSGLNPSAISSSESSGQVTGSSGEGGVHIGPPADVPSDSDGNVSSGTPLLARTIDPSPELQFNNSGVFNINLNSVSIANPVDTWTGFKPGGTVTEEPDALINSSPTGLSLNGDSFLRSPGDLGALEQTDADIDYSVRNEEDRSDNCENCHSDDQPVSGYMTR